MINKAIRGRGDARLASYLTERADNDDVVELPARGVVADQFGSQLREIVARCQHGRTDRPILHLCVSPSSAWTEAQYQRYLELYESEFDLAGQPRLAVHHSKNGRDHRHYVYSLVKRDGRVVDLRHDYARREKIARVVEYEFGEPHVTGGHNRAVAAALEREGRHDVVASMREAGLLDQRRPVTRMMAPRRLRGAAVANHHQRIARLVFEAWRSSDDGHSFQRALAERGLVLARGNQVSVVVDQGGVVLPLARLIGQSAHAETGTWVAAALVEARIAHLALPLLAEVRRKIALADTADHPDPSRSSDHQTAPATTGAHHHHDDGDHDNDAMLAGCAAFIDDIAEEMISATADQGAISAWGEEALDQIATLIDHAAQELCVELCVAQNGYADVGAWDDKALNQVAGLIDDVASFSVSHDGTEKAGLIDAADGPLDDLGTTNGAILARDIVPIEPAISGIDPVTAADPIWVSADAQDQATEPISARGTAAPPSPDLTSSSPSSPATCPKSDQPEERKHDQRADQPADQQQSTLQPDGRSGDGAYTGTSTRKPIQAEGDKRTAGQIFADGGRHETHSGTDRSDRGPPVGRADGRASERRADLAGAGRADQPHSGAAPSTGRGNSGAPTTGTNSRRGGQASIEPKRDAAMIHQKKKPPVPQRSIWQTALGRVRAEIGVIARALVGLRGISQSSGQGPSAQTNPRARAGAAQIQPTRNNVINPSADSRKKVIPSGSGAPQVAGYPLATGGPSLKSATIQPDTQSAPPAALPAQRLPATQAIRSDQRDGHARSPTPVADIDEAKPIAALANRQAPPLRPLAPASRPFRYTPTLPAVPTINPKPILNTPNPDPDDYDENCDSSAPGM